jgi:hypothetical protein
MAGTRRLFRGTPVALGSFGALAIGPFGTIAGRATFVGTLPGRRGTFAGTISGGGTFGGTLAGGSTIIGTLTGRRGAFAGTLTRSSSPFE